MSNNQPLIPEAARERMAQELQKGSNWSSDLSVAELAAIRHAGFEPIDVVMGSSIYHVGAQWGGQYTGNGWQRSYGCMWGYSAWGNDHWQGWNWEHTQYEAGVYEAYKLASSRLVEEAREVKAHGVVGVRITMDHLEGVGGLIQFTAIGTAIRRAGVAPLETPFTSHLSGTEFAKLIQTGLMPTSLIFATAACQINEGCSVEHSERSWSTQEITQIAEAVTWTRHTAVRYLQQECAQLGERVVGVEIDFSMHEIGSRTRLAHMNALGTVVHEFQNVPLPAAPMIIMRLS